jgi:hypothetical protein
MRRLVAFLALVAAAAAGVFAVHDGLSDAHRNPAFDAEAWAAPVEYCVDSPRRRMVRDLVEHHLRHGLAVSRVRDLLGRPDVVDRGLLVYNVGSESSGFGPRTCVTLEIRTRSGRVVSAAVQRDD